MAGLAGTNGGEANGALLGGPERVGEPEVVQESGDKEQFGIDAKTVYFCEQAGPQITSLAMGQQVGLRRVAADAQRAFGGLAVGRREGVEVDVESRRPPETKTIEPLFRH